MRKVYCVFGGRAYDERIGRTVQDAPKYGATDVFVYDDKWLVEQSEKQPGFYAVNQWLWQTERNFGFGWCSWKPYIIMDALTRVSNGDVVLYVDADCVPIADLSPIWSEAAEKGLMLFDCQGFTNENVVRRDCFIAMGMDSEKYWHGKHACGRFQAFRKGCYLGQQILQEWLTYSINPLCQQWRDYQSQYGKDLADFTIGLSKPGGGEHRTEQAVLSLLALKYDVQLYREACQWGWPVDAAYCQAHSIVGDLYPQLFDQQYCQGDRTDISGSRYRNMGVNLDFA